jgi:hypothetical protein
MRTSWRLLQHLWCTRVALRVLATRCRFNSHVKAYGMGYGWGDSSFGLESDLARGVTRRGGSLPALPPCHHRRALFRNPEYNSGSHAHFFRPACQI